MNYFFAASVFANAMFLILMMQGPTAPLDASTAKLAVREEIENLSDAAFGAPVTMGAACAEQRGSEGIVSGKGQTARRSATMEGVVVSEETKFSYKAEVLNRCSRWNPGCYDVYSLGFSGTNFVTPKI